MSEFIAEAQVLITPNVATFATTLRAQVEAAVAKVGPVAIPVAAVVAPASKASLQAAAASTSALATAQAEVTDTSLGLASAEKVLNSELARGVPIISASALAERDLAAAETAAGVAASVSAAKKKDSVAASRVAAASAAAEARGLRQLERGAAASTLTLFGLRGATLAASGRFIAGVAAVELFKRALSEASNETEQLNKTREVFGKFSEEVEKFSQTSAEAFGESRASALELASTFGALLRPIGFTKEAAASMSVSLTKLGADLASFFNTDVSDALAAIQSGLVGQVRPLRRYGIEVSAARVQSEALAETGKSVAKQLTNQEKVAARVALIFKDSSIAQGDFARTSGEFANQTRILSAEVANLEGELGRLAIPTLTVLLTGLTLSLAALNKFAAGLSKVADAARDVARDIKSIPQGKIQLPIITAPSGGGGAGGLRGVLGDIGRIEQKLSLLPSLLHTAFTPVETESQKTAKAVREIFKAASESQSIARFNGDMQRLADTLKQGNPEQQRAALAVQTLVDTVSRLGHLPGPEEFSRLMKEVGISVDGTSGSVQGLNANLLILTGRMTGATDQAGNLKKALRDLQSASGAAAAALLKIQSEGGGPAAQLPAARAQLAADQAVLAQALALSPSAKGRATAVKKAREAVVADRAFIESLTGQITSAQEQATANAARERANAAEKQANQTIAFIEKFTGTGSKLQEALSRAASNDNFKKQIAINKAIIANDVKEITALKERIRHLHLHGAALKAAQAAIQAANREIDGARAAIANAQQARKQAIQDAINTRLDLRIQLAQARDNVGAEIKARTARLANITAQLAKLKNAHKKNTNAWLELKVQQAEEIAAINELKKTTDEKKKAQSSAFFSFLQTQEGFAANLLGNLIPGFATRGLVGGGSSTGPAAGAAFSDLGVSPGKGVQQTAAIGASQAAGVKPVQVDTTNQLLRQILAAVQGRGRPAPETVHNRRVGSAMMDTLGGIHGA